MLGDCQLSLYIIAWDNDILEYFCYLEIRILLEKSCIFSKWKFQSFSCWWCLRHLILDFIRIYLKTVLNFLNDSNQGPWAGDPSCLSVCLSECRSSARPHTTRAGLWSQVFRQPWDYIICLMMCLIPEIGPVCTGISFQPLSLYYSYFLCHAIFISLERKQEKTSSFCDDKCQVPMSQYCPNTSDISCACRKT